MKDDFDDGMGMPDDELTGGSSLSDVADITSGSLEGDLLGELEEPSGRPSGGARARKVTFVPRPRAAAKAAKPAKKKTAKKAAKKAPKKAAKKKGARKAKAARKGSSKKRAGKKK